MIRGVLIGLLLVSCAPQTLSERAIKYCNYSREPNKHLCSIGFILCMTPDHPAYPMNECVNLRKELGE